MNCSVERSSKASSCSRIGIISLWSLGKSHVGCVTCLDTSVGILAESTAGLGLFCGVSHDAHCLLALTAGKNNGEKGTHADVGRGKERRGGSLPLGFAGHGPVGSGKLS